MKAVWCLGTLTILTTCLLGFLIFEHEQWKQRCIDAGGVPAGACINPASVIEVD
jgi:hypothetical protein